MPRFAALLIGVSAFDEPDVFPPLPGVTNDLEIMKTLEEYGFEVQSYLNLPKKQILQKIENYDGEVLETFVLYFSTHGTSKGNMGYLIPRDARGGKKNNVVLDTAISATEIMDSLAGIKAKRKLLLLDTCHSGGFFKLKNISKAPNQLGKSGLNSFIERASEQNFGQGRGLAVISAARNGEAAVCEDDGSVFTKRFVETLRSIPKDQIMLFTLVKKLQKAMENDAHMPVFKCDNVTEVYAWLIARNPNFAQITVQEEHKEAADATPTAPTLKRKRSEFEDNEKPPHKKSKTEAACLHKNAVTKKSYTERNPGKYFRKCPDCNHFEWRCPELSDKSKDQLKSLCQEMNLKRSGTKAELRDRILVSYKNAM